MLLQTKVKGVLVTTVCGSLASPPAVISAAENASRSFSASAFASTSVAKELLDRKDGAAAAAVSSQPWA
jgi:hypothetical protein